MAWYKIIPYHSDFWGGGLWHDPIEAVYFQADTEYANRVFDRYTRLICFTYNLAFNARLYITDAPAESEYDLLKRKPEWHLCWV